MKESEQKFISSTLPENPRSSDPRAISVVYTVDQVAIAHFPPSLYQFGETRMKENGTGIFTLEFKADGTVILGDGALEIQIVNDGEKMVGVTKGEPLSITPVEYFDNRK